MPGSPAAGASSPGAGSVVRPSGAGGAVSSGVGSAERPGLANQSMPYPGLPGCGSPSGHSSSGSGSAGACGGSAPGVRGSAATAAIRRDFSDGGGASSGSAYARSATV